MRRAGEEIRSGRQLIIFPEGTRTPVGAPPDYMTGVGQIYANSGVPCLPVALNSGLFWPRRTFMRYPGTLVVEFLDPLPPGLPRKEFIARIRTVIEDATNRLVEAARGSRRNCSAGLRLRRLRKPAGKVFSSSLANVCCGPVTAKFRSAAQMTRCARSGSPRPQLITSSARNSSDEGTFCRANVHDRLGGPWALGRIRHCPHHCSC